MNRLTRLYRRIGLHEAPPGTVLYGIHQMFMALTGRIATVPGDDVLPDKDVIVAFRVSGGIGDHLIAARYIRDLLAAVGDFRFDIYSSRRRPLSGYSRNSGSSTTAITRRFPGKPGATPIR